MLGDPSEHVPKARSMINVPILAVSPEFLCPVSMLIGYSRLSTQEQALTLQQDALKKAGCERIFTDTVSGAKWTTQERVSLSETPQFMRAGDALVVWKLDQLGRSLELSRACSK